MPKLVINKEKDGIEIYFEYIPSKQIRNKLKDNGFRFHSQKQCWYAKRTEKRLNYAKGLCKETVNQRLNLYDVSSCDNRVINTMKSDDDYQKRLRNIYSENKKKYVETICGSESQFKFSSGKIVRYSDWMLLCEIYIKLENPEGVMLEIEYKNIRDNDLNVFIHYSQEETKKLCKIVSKPIARFFYEKFSKEIKLLYDAEKEKVDHEKAVKAYYSSERRKKREEEERIEMKKRNGTYSLFTITTDKDGFLI